MNIDELHIDDVKTELKTRGITLHHKTGEAKLRQTLSDALDGTYEATVPSTPVSAKTASKPQSIEQKAMQLVRIVVSPNDPLQGSYPGLIFTVCSSIINRGKAVKKFVPFNNDEGWHVPQILVDQIQAAEMQKFKNVKNPTTGEAQLVPYITKKYNVQILDALNEEELAELATQQKARGDT